MAMMMDMNGGGGNNNGGNNNGGVSNGGGGVYGESGVSGDIKKWNICINGFKKMDQLLYNWDINGLDDQMQYNCCVWLVKVTGIRAGSSDSVGVGKGHTNTHIYLS